MTQRELRGRLAENTLGINFFDGIVQKVNTYECVLISWKISCSYSKLVREIF